MKKYQTLEEASQAARRLEIKTVKEYQRRYKEDPRLPFAPHLIYPQEWTNWRDFAGPVFYESFIEVTIAAQKLKCKSVIEYQTRYIEDPKLPCTPHRIYPQEWTNWNDFLGKGRERRKCFYSTLKEASQAVKKLNIKSSYEYKQRYKEDKKLPCNPYANYKSEWTNWFDFLGTSKPKSKKYQTLEEASKAATALGIRTCEYNYRYSEDPMLPVAPQVTYKDKGWISWSVYLNTHLLPRLDGTRMYETIEEASKATIALGIKTCTEYKQNYKKDPRLWRNPELKYLDWDCWPTFLNNGRKANTTKSKAYATYSEASAAATAMGITSRAEYRARYKDDPKLVYLPESLYSNEWKGFHTFLSIKRKIYPTIEQAGKAARDLGISSREEYSFRYKEDRSLPSIPSAFYKPKWKGWDKFLGKKCK